MQLFTMISLPFRLIDQTIDFACGGGSWWLRSYEKEIVEAASAQLSDKNKSVLREQLSKFFYAQRLFGRKLTTIHHYDTKTIVKFDLPESYRMANFKVVSEVGGMNVSVSVLGGHLIEIRFGEDPRGFFSKPYKLVPVEFGGEADQGLQKSAQRLEHGSEE